MKPDWSFQDKAVSKISEDIFNTNFKKLGVFIPTGGGKTRVALRVCDEYLSREIDKVKILWVVHRTFLKEQALRDSQDLLLDGVLKNASFQSQVDFVMLSEAQGLDLDDYGLIIVDEAHHFAASSYRFLDSLGEDHKMILLTATPNRMDGLDIGVEKRSFEITYNELFHYGVIIEPKFIPLDLVSFDLKDSTVCEKIVKFILSNYKIKFRKIMVLANKVDDINRLYRSLLSVNAENTKVNTENIFLFYGQSPTLERDMSRSKIEDFGIIFSTQQLVGEGYNDNSIDSVLITYPTESITVKMQVAGRCLRYYPGKESSYIIQIRNSSYSYYFDNNWIDSDISDYLKPEIINIDSLSDLEKMRQRYSFEEYPGVEPEPYSLGIMISTVFLGNPEEFNENEDWRLILLSEREEIYLKKIINYISSGKNKIYSQRHFLVSIIGLRDDEVDKFIPITVILTCAFDEIKGEGVSNRNYVKGSANTWWKLVKFGGLVSSDVDNFLKDCENREDFSGVCFIENSLFKIPIGDYLFRAYVIKSSVLEVFLDSAIYKTKNSDSLHFPLILSRNMNLFLNKSIRERLIFSKEKK